MLGVDGANGGVADEAELIERSSKGDSAAFGVLVERYQRRVVGVAMAVVHNQDDAIELAQETFIRAYENLSKFESRGYSTCVLDVEDRPLVLFESEWAMNRAERENPTVKFIAAVQPGRSARSAA